MTKVINRQFIERIKGESSGVVVTGGSGGGGGMTIDVQEGQGTGNAYTEFTFDSGVLTLNKAKTLVDTAAVDQTIAGNKTFSNTVVAPEFQGPSDERLKDFTGDIHLTAVQVAKAPSKLFKWKGKTNDKKIHGGTIAQYWTGIAPWAVTKDENGLYRVNYPNLALASAIATARELVALRKEVADLKAMIMTMKQALQNQ
jgi:hypothetical protein